MRKLMTGSAAALSTIASLLRAVRFLNPSTCASCACDHVHAITHNTHKNARSHNTQHTSTTSLASRARSATGTSVCSHSFTTTARAVDDTTGVVAVRADMPQICAVCVSA
jgi:CTP:molybdopterin cytidylyltransferase MocA